MIHAQNLTKWYGPTLAVDDVSFEVPRGQIVGFLGPNGAGKSTTLRMLTGYLPPSKGKATLDGHDVISASRQARLQLGYLPESTPLYRDMRVTEYLDYRGKLYDMSRSSRKQRMAEVVSRCGLEPVKKRTIGRLSKGNRQRVGLAQALLHKPSVLILDEPTAGLDPNQITTVRQLIEELKGDHTILLSTHILPEVEKTADRVLIIAGGKLVADGTPKDLRQTLTEKKRITMTAKADPQDMEKAIMAMPGSMIHKLKLTAEGTYTRAQIEPTEKSDPVDALGQLAADHQWALRELRHESQSLEDYFTSVTQPTA